MHGVYSPSTQTWQYIVADPATGYCVIFDPIRDGSQEEVNVSTTAADEVLEIVRRRGYFVQCIIETRTSHSSVRSAAWYLRMRLRDWQGQAPSLYSRGATVDVMARLFDRKYGSRSGFTSTIQRPLGDGEVTMVGHMPVKSLPIAGSGIPGHCAFLIGKSLFGAHSILQNHPRVRASADGSYGRTESDQNLMGEYTWRSLQRAFAGQESVRVYYDEGPSRENIQEPYDEVKQLFPPPRVSSAATSPIHGRLNIPCKA